ncbi:MAG: hypothetical protein QME58_14395, partial [Bacteroidota bacterium]|nr:hypothetical protein [Bacteroidota bacterium]
MNSQVQLEWVARYNSQSNGSDYARAMAIDSMGNVYVLGADADDPPGPLVLKYNSSGQLVWKRKLTTISQLLYSGGREISVDKEGNVLIGGVVGKDYFIIKYDLNGLEQWVRRHTGTAGGRSELFDISVYKDSGSMITAEQGPVATGYVKNIGT